MIQSLMRWRSWPRRCSSLSSKRLAWKSSALSTRRLTCVVLRIRSSVSARWPRWLWRIHSWRRCRRSARCRRRRRPRSASRITRTIPMGPGRTWARRGESIVRTMTIFERSRFHFVVYFAFLKIRNKSIKIGIFFHFLNFLFNHQISFKKLELIEDKQWECCYKQRIWAISKLNVGSYSLFLERSQRNW